MLIFAHADDIIIIVPAVTKELPRNVSLIKHLLYTRQHFVARANVKV